MSEVMHDPTTTEAANAARAAEIQAIQESAAQRDRVGRVAGMVGTSAEHQTSAATIGTRPVEATAQP